MIKAAAEILLSGLTSKQLPVIDGSGFADRR